MDIQIETITPLKAQMWLETQTSNRACSRSTVRRYAAAIRRGEWELNGEAIKFDPAGKLIDGQHRLNAVVLAESPIKSVVIRGLNGKAFETFDTGKNRSISDLLSLYGFANCHVLASLSRMLYNYQVSGNPALNPSVNLRVSGPLLASFVRDPSRTEALVSAAREGQQRFVKGSFFSPGLAAFLWYVTHKSDPVIADEFFDAMKSSIREDDPASLLSARIAKSRLQKTTTSMEEACALSIKAWNAFAQNLPMKLLKHKMVGARLDKFPSIYGVDQGSV